MNKVGIFGGTFDPVHKGHEALAREAFRALKLHEMLIIPTAAPPHKEKAEVPFSDRFEMCALAFADDEGFSVSDIEKRLGGKSYTINTVRALREIYPKDTEFYLIIGSDMLFSFTDWYRYEALLKECHVVAAAREDDSYADMLEAANDIGKIRVLNLPVKEISSTDIREKLINGEDTGEALSPRVLDYITSRRLYRG